MTTHDDGLQRAADLARASYAQKRDGKTPVQIDAELQHAQALALIEIAYSLRRIEGLMRR
jgi:hypothetical protein